MPRYVSIHTLPGFTREQLAQATPHLDKQEGTRFFRAYSSFTDGRVVCEWESADKEHVAKAFANLGFPYDSIDQVDAICDTGAESVETRWL
jgi:Protein of unknown function (DUF4242)